jgi:hypothetical protein
MKVAQLLREESLEDYLKRLVTKEKIKKLGGGAFSQVFQHPQFHNVVTKVYSGKDKLFAKYVQWCLQHQNNPYVPEIIEQVEYQNPDPGAKIKTYHIVFMQKMTPIKTEKVYTAAFVKALGLDASDDDEEEIIDQLADGIDTADMYVITSAVKQAFKLGKGDKYFVEMWKHILSYGVNNLDLHKGNVMLRGKQLVFSDPVAPSPTVRIDTGQMGDPA